MGYIKLLKGKNTKLVLYTYDAFLLDVDKREEETIKSVLKVFENYKLKVKIKHGDSYDFAERD